MQSLQVFENETIYISDKPLLDKKVLSERHAAALLEQEHWLPGNAVKWGLNRLVFSRCGVVCVDDCEIEILPRVSVKIQTLAFSRNVFINMLKVSGHFLSASPSYHPHLINELSFLDRYIFQFCEDLSYHIRQGMIRVYVNQRNSLPLVRGRLLLNQQLQLNSITEENAVCEYDELTLDNAYNRTLKTVLRLLLKVVRSGNVRRKITELLNYFGRVSDELIGSREVKKLHFDRVNKRYETIFKHCHRLLLSYKCDLSSDGLKSFSYLFDMSELFKEYFSALVQKYQWGKGVYFKEGSSVKYLVHDLRINKDYVLLKPDMSVLDKNRKLLALVNIKWNSGGNRRKKLSLSEQDLCQVFSYAACYQVNKVFLIYPAGSDTKTHSIYLKANGAEVELVLLYMELNETAGFNWESFSNLC